MNRRDTSSFVPVTASAAAGAPVPALLMLLSLLAAAIVWSTGALLAAPAADAERSAGSAAGQPPVRTAPRASAASRTAMRSNPASPASGASGMATSAQAQTQAQPQTPPQSQTQPQPQAPMFRSNVDVVYVNVIVRDSAGRPVRGLTPEDFTLTEDGKTQSVTTFAYEEVGQEVTSTLGPVVAGLLPGVGRPVRPAAGAPRSAADDAAARAAAPSAAATAGATATPPLPADLHGRRLVVLFFDLSAMQPEEIERAGNAARIFVDTKLAPDDLVAVTRLSTNLEVLQDFTTDRERLQSVIVQFSPNASQGFEETATTADAAADTSGTAEFAADDSEFNLFNTDRRLEALGQVAGALGAIEQRKSLVYFSGGMSRTDVDNQVLLLRTIDRAVRANVSIYTMDTRGLQAFVPGGEAQQASAGGASAFSGAAMRSRISSQTDSQEALSALARDTGGQAVFDTNDFAEVFDRVVADTEAYYVIGYSSTNAARDGRYRRIKVQVRAGAGVGAAAGAYRIEHRSGYYAGRDFAHASRADREQQLQDQLTTDLSATDLPVYVSAAYFRLSASRYAVPLSVAVPGSRVPFTKSGDKARATLDLLGVVTDEQRRPVARVRDTLRLSADDAAAAARTIQYQTTLDLPPGRYRVKVVARENEQGTLGAYERDIIVPALNGAALRASAVVMGTRLGAEDRSRTSPLVTLAEGLVPNVAPVVTARQRVYFYFEVYDPRRATGESPGPGAASAAPSASASAPASVPAAASATASASPSAPAPPSETSSPTATAGAATAGAATAGTSTAGTSTAGAAAPEAQAQRQAARRGAAKDAAAKAIDARDVAAKDDPVRVLASLSFLRKGVRVYQTPIVSVTRLSAPERTAAAFRLELPPGSLAPGLYTCQINIIDDAAGEFAFPRMPLLVRP